MWREHAFGNIAGNKTIGRSRLFDQVMTNSVVRWKCASGGHAFEEAQKALDLLDRVLIAWDIAALRVVSAIDPPDDDASLGVSESPNGSREILTVSIVKL